MRIKQKIVHTSDLFGHNYCVQDSEHTAVLVTGLDSDWTPRQRRLKQFYWFRAPAISLEQLCDTARCLANTDGRFQLEIWRHAQTWEASVKFEDEMDAVTWSWSLGHCWQKWNAEEEKQFLQQLRSKRPRVRVNKNGQARVTVTVTELQD